MTMRTTAPSSAARLAGRDPLATAAMLVAAGGALTILGAWFFEYGLGLAPCPLCLQQRWPYYLAIPLSVAVAVGAAYAAPRTLLIGGLVAAALALFVGAALGAYHAGIEWKWWEGPQDCAGAGFSGGSAGNLLQRMQTARVVRCDEAAWRFLGLSLAGWNVLIALSLVALAIWGATARPRSAP
ncbi:MAG TPA: disulfide bond formation protein B [Xanthobacteraceae bacterium]|nr:disulfide bond formation protein B [Xanthobacteraceae bacterium]